MKLSSFKLLVPVISGLLLTLHPETSRAANTLGIDVNSSQGSINWSSVYGCGVRFAFARATEGNYFHDAYFLQNMLNGKAAGVKMGAYHFARPDVDCPSVEANYFWNFAGGQIIADGKSLFPALDLETFNGTSCASNYTAWVNTWAADVKAKTSHFLHPVLATTCQGACLTTGNALEFWGLNPGSSTTGCPCGPTSWTYWLVSGSGAICGISGNCDIDQYNGTYTNLVATQIVK